MTLSVLNGSIVGPASVTFALSPLDTYSHIRTSAYPHSHLPEEPTARALRVQSVQVECSLSEIDGLAYGHRGLKCLKRVKGRMQHGCNYVSTI